MGPTANKAPQQHDPRAGLSPWVIGGALTAAAAAWLVVELIGRAL